MTVPALLPSTGWLLRANRLALLERLLAASIHDVNNALQVISGGGELLETQPADVGVVAHALASQTGRASNRLAEVMAFARDRGTASPTPLDLAALSHEVIGLRRAALGRLRVRTVLTGDAPPAQATRHDVLQILLNLVVNAEQALAGRSSPVLRIVLDDEPGMTRARVVDNGPGLATDVVTTMFNRPVMSGDAVDRLGIGLWASRQLAARHGGTLDYTPVAEGGAAFTLRLPTHRP